MLPGLKHSATVTAMLGVRVMRQAAESPETSYEQDGASGHRGQESEVLFSASKNGKVIAYDLLSRKVLAQFFIGRAVQAEGPLWRDDPSY